MRRSPGFTMVAIVTLALGIGANSALFSVVNAVFLRPLAYPDPDRLVLLWGTTPNIPKEEASLPDYTDWKSQSRSFEGMAALRFINANVTGDTEPERVIGARVTHDFLDVLRVVPALGRSFKADEDRPGAGKVVILSHGFWRRRFAGDATILGKSIRVNDEPHTVVGVMPEHFRLPVNDAAVYVPIATDPATTGRRNDAYVVMGRLADGMQIDEAQAEMKGIASRLAQQYPSSNATWTVRVVPMLEDVVGEYRLALGLLFAAVGCVLLIACANVANLLLARATARQRDLAIRAALGAGRAGLVRQMLVESTVLALIGGAAGLLIASWGKAALLRLSPVAIPRLDEAALDLRVLAFTLGVAILTGVVFGLAPALQVVRTSPQSTLKEGGRGIAGDARGRMRSVLVASQLGLALVLLVGTGLAVQSFAHARRVAPGFEAGHALTARVSLPTTRYAEDPQVLGFFTRLEEQLRGMPGVMGVSFANALPIAGGGPFYSFTIDGAPAPAPGDAPDANVRIVSTEHFAQLRIPLRAGRLPDSHDRSESPQVAVVNETLVREVMRGENPLGKRISFASDDQGKPLWNEIVGVVGDVKHQGLDRNEVRAVYLPLAQTATRSMAIVLRSGESPEKLTSGLLSAVRAVDPGLPVYSVRTYDQIVRVSLQARRFAMLLLGFFAVVGLALAAVGIYGVLSYAVTQRRQEIAVRMALGAARRDVVQMVVRQGMTLAGVGLALGTLASLLVLSLSSTLLFEISPFDPVALGSAVLLLGAISLAACLVPATRAAAVDPMVALRHE
jgi:putative ABC transport system permease protein